ncbi:MAG: hypothetical protein QOH88_467 [Verrucomicrobiota bacterium]|jgi:hypothetical protein
MPFCKIRTSRLSYAELRRITGLFGFPVVSLLKLIRCDFPVRGEYLMPCLWRDMQVPAEALSVEARSHIDAVRPALPTSNQPWECYYFRRPNRGAVITDSGGAFFFAPGERFSLMHVYARPKVGSAVSNTYVGSFRLNGHTIATTNNLRGFEPVSGSVCYARPGTPSELIQQHRSTIASVPDLAIFRSFTELTAAYDRKETMQSDWDFARGAFSPVTAA